MEKLITAKNARISLIIVCLITVFFTAYLPQLKLSYDFEKFFPQYDKELDFYLAHREKYETDNDFLLIAIKPSGGIFNATFLEKLDSLSKQCSKLANVESAYCILNYQLPLLTPIGWNITGKLDYKDSEQLPYDSIRLCTDPNVMGNLLSKDRHTTTLILRNTPTISKKNSDVLLTTIDSLINDKQFAEVHIAGKIHGQYHYIKKMGRELVMFACISIILLCGFLYFTFRTTWGVFMPLLVVGLTTFWLMGFIAAIGEQINILCTILPTILFVVGISDSVHILEKYVYELRLGKNKRDALISAYKHVGFATFLTAITNAIGFLTLQISNIEPIRQFGLYTAIGILFAFILSYSLLPVAILFFKTPTVAERKNNDTFWNKVLPKLFLFVLANRKKIAYGAVALSAVSLVGVFQLKINNYLLEDWSEDDPQKIDYVFFEKNFSGVRPFEMAISLRDTTKTVFEPEVVIQLNNLQNYLENTYGIGAVVSPVGLVKTLNRAAHSGDNTFYSLPKNEQEWQAIQIPLKKALKNNKSRAYISKDLHEARISGRITDYGGYAFKAKNKALLAYIDTHIDSNLLTLQQTGMPMLIDKNNENLAGDIGYELGLSLLLVAAIMGFLFKNFRIVLISIIPNLIPLLVVAGFMGAVGIDLKVSTSLIFSIAFGIAVDDTIHFMSNLKWELKQGKSPLYALKSTYLNTGKAVTITNLILFSGFFSLVLSSFASTFYMGLLVSITLFVALLAELLLLPILFVSIYKVKP